MPKPIRIVHVVQSLNFGGMENVLSKVAAELRPRGFDIHVCCLGEKGALANRHPDPVVHALNKAPGFQFHCLIQLRRKIKELTPDLIHTHNIGPLVYGVPATIGLGIPLLHGEHGQLSREKLGAKGLRFRRWLYRGCNCIHTVSKSQLAGLVSCGLCPREKCEAIVNGVEYEHFVGQRKDPARQALGLSPEIKVIGVVGRLHPGKRQEFLVDSMPYAGSNIHLAIFGDGQNQESLTRQIAASPAKERIHFFGHQNDMLPCYQALDLLVIPSISEGLSNVLLEAMSCGVPALGNDICGNSEVIAHGEDGWIVPMTDPEAFGRLLNERLADSEGLAEAGRKAREKMMTEFSFARTVDHYEKVYRRLLSE